VAVRLARWTRPCAPSTLARNSTPCGTHVDPAKNNPPFSSVCKLENLREGCYKMAWNQYSTFKRHLTEQPLPLGKLSLNSLCDALPVLLVQVLLSEMDSQVYTADVHHAPREVGGKLDAVLPREEGQRVSIYQGVKRRRPARHQQEERKKRRKRPQKYTTNTTINHIRGRGQFKRYAHSQHAHTHTHTHTNREATTQITGLWGMPAYCIYERRKEQNNYDR